MKLTIDFVNLLMNSRNVYDAYVLNKKTPTRKEREERRRAKLQKGQSKGEEQEQRPSPDPSEADEHQEAGEQEDLLETAEAVQQVVIQEDNVIPNEIPVQPVVSEASYVFQTDAVNNELYQQQQQQLPQQQHQDYNTETPVEYVSQGADPTYTISVPTAQVRPAIIIRCLIINHSVLIVWFVRWLQPTSEYTTVNGSPLKQHPVAAYTIAATDVPTTELQVPPVTHQVPAVPEAGGPLLLSSQRKTYMTPEQRRIGILKKLQEMTTFLKSSSPDDLKSELMDSLETKPVTNVIIPSVKIKMIKNCSYDSDLPARKAREKRARKKREKEEAARLAAAATAEAVAGLEELQSQGVKPTR